jgi:Flp pilus assembly protein protease CpaA
MYGLIGIVYFIVKATWPIAALSLLYLCGKALGAGDIKLFSVMAPMVGAKATVEVMIVSVIVAAITIIVVSIYERHLLRRKLHYSFYITAAFFLLHVQT